MQKFKEGDKLKVVANLSDHEFNIGESIIVKRCDPMANDGEGDYFCSNGLEGWHLTDEEVVLDVSDIHCEAVRFLEWVAGKNYHQLKGGVMFRQAESDGIEQLSPLDLYKIFKCQNS